MKKRSDLVGTSILKIEIQSNMTFVRIPRHPSRDTTDLLDQLRSTVGVVTCSLQQGCAEGIAIFLLANSRPLLSAHVLIFLLEVRAESE